MTKRRLVLSVLCVLAVLQAEWAARTQDALQAVVVRPDGSTLAWTGGSAALEPASSLTGVVAVGFLGDELLTARADGTVWLGHPDDGGGSPIADAPRLRSISCSRHECAAVTGTDEVVLWRGGTDLIPMNGLEDVAAVAVAERHVLALTHTARVWAWGFNDRGQLGDDTAQETDRPIQVPGLDHVVSIAATADQSAATRSDGSVMVWGANDAGQLGLGDADDRRSPAQVPGMRQAVQVAMAPDRTFVLMQDGALAVLGGPEEQAPRARMPGEIARLHRAGSTVIAERSDGAYWDLVSGRALAMAPSGARDTVADEPGEADPSESPEPLPLEPPSRGDGRAVVLTGGGAPTAIDLFAQSRLERLGLQTVLVRQTGDLALIEGASLLVVSPSVQAQRLDAGKLRTLAVPMIVGERFLFDGLGLTMRDLLPAHASENGRQLAIIRTEHALAAGLEGVQDVLAGPGTIATGTPARGGVVVAVTDTGAPALVAFEEAAETRLGPAPARRVLWPLPAQSGASVTARGAELYDAAVRWALGGPSHEHVGEPQERLASGNILLVVGSLALTPGDAVYKARMEGLGFTVTLKLASAATAADATGMAMVFVSNSAPNGDVLAKFKAVAVPVTIQTAGIVDDMGMSSTGSNGQCASASNQGTIVTSSHPIALGLTGTLTLSASAGTQQFGAPSASGVTVLRCPAGTSSQGTGFTYVTGNVMADGTAAAARRTMWSFYSPIPDSFTNVGADLFDRMLLWTTSSPNQAPIVNAGPDQAATTCEVAPCTTIALAGHVFHDGLPTSTLTSVQWSVVTGNVAEVHFATPNAETTNVTFDNTGTYVLRLTANDGALIGSDDVTIEVSGQGSNLPPVVNAGPDQFIEFPSGATLVGVVTDDGLPNPPGARTYQWTQVSGPGTAVFGSAAALSTTATVPVKGQYVFRLTASDGSLSSYDDVVVTSEKAVLLVVGNPALPLPPGDAALKKRFEDLGFPVTLKDDSVVVGTDAANKAFVWLSSTVDPGFGGGAPPYLFSTTAIPVAVQISGYADNLGLTDGTSNGNGNAFNQGQVTITAPASALSAGLVNTVTTSTVGQYDWGVPAAAAPPPQPAPIAVARLTTNPPLQHVVFAYPLNAQMYSGPANGKRLFFGFQGGPLAGFTADGRKLLDAAIYWLSGKNAPPWVDAGPSRTAALAPTSAVVSLAGYVVDDGQLAATPTLIWSVVSGPGPVTFSNTATAVTNATFTVVGDYVLRLAASDGKAAEGGRQSSDVTFVSILPAGSNARPSVSAGPDGTVRLPQKGLLNATASDDGLPSAPGALTYNWTQVAGPAGVAFGTGSALSTTATFPSAGVYTLRITVGDGALVASDDVQYTVEPTQSALFIVQDPAALDTHDARVKTELENLGFTPNAKAPSGPSGYGSSDVTAASVILVSSSISSANLGAAFQTTAKPVVMWEPELFDEMGMTAVGGSGADTNGGAGHTNLAITAPGHPLAAALSGTQAVFSQPAAVEWGVPGSRAVKAAVLATDPSKAAVFGYEAGSSMVTGVAPARRVGFFGSGAGLWTPSGTALFRAAVNWATQRTVNTLFVANTLPLSASDLALKERLHALGYAVTVVTGTAAVGADANGKAFVVIANAPTAAAKFRNSTTAVVTWEGAVMSAMNLVGPTSGTHYGTLAGQTKVSILDRYHPLAAGLKNLGTTSSSATYTWGVPTTNAARVASLETDASKLTVFGYEVGAPLVSGAPASTPDRRVGLFLPNPATSLTAQGTQLFEAAIQWAAASDPDRDGLGTADEYRYGTDPQKADTNDDGILDGPSVQSGLSPTSTDVDGDGLTNLVERGQGTDPFQRDTDGDGVKDGLAGLTPDCFPLDPTRSACPAAIPGDTTPPVITLGEPTNAVPLP